MAKFTRAKQLLTEAKSSTIELPNTNLHISGVGRDRNGNSIIKVQFPNSRSFSIQLNDGSLKQTYSLLKGKKNKDLKDLSDEDLSIISKEVADYVKSYGSDNQKKSLKIYESSLFRHKHNSAKELAKKLIERSSRFEAEMSEYIDAVHIVADEQGIDEIDNNDAKLILAHAIDMIIG